MNWNNLSAKQKKQYEEYCNKRYGKTIVRCSTGEPMYIDEQGCCIDTRIIIELLFSLTEN